MAFKIKAEITGLEDLVKQLRDELPRRMQSKILKKAIGDGSKVILKAARQKVPKGETGLLKKSLGRRIKVYRLSGKVIAMVGPRTGFKKTKAGRVRTKLGEEFSSAQVDPSKYAHLVEKGTKPHAIKITNGPFKGRTIQHPGSPAQPFLRPALDNNIARVREIFATVIKEGLEKNRVGTVPPEGMQID